MANYCRAVTKSPRGTITNYEKVQILKSEPKKFSRLCTFKEVSIGRSS
jgi:hypothetical protein